MEALFTGYLPEEFLLHAVFILVCSQRVYFFSGTIRTRKSKADVITVSKEQTK